MLLAEKPRQSVISGEVETLLIIDISYLSQLNKHTDIDEATLGVASFVSL